MNPDMFNAAQLLADVLEKENDALKRLDFPAAVALVPAKDMALADLMKQPTVTSPPLMALMRQVGALAAENQQLLERALAVQTRIMRIVARASIPAPVTIQYNEHGGQTPWRRAAARSVSTQA